MTPPNIPLAERVRPQHLESFIGQSHLIGDQSLITKIIEGGHIPSMILWGPPGVGKTTLAGILAKSSGLPSVSISAIHSGVKEVREILDTARKAGKMLLFIDEIHRFNKSQQDSLLKAVENGTITLIGATTENPSFEVISALLSRCQVYILKEHSQQSLLAILQKAIKEDPWLQNFTIRFDETELLIRYSGGDARKLLNIFELIVAQQKSKTVAITNQMVLEVVQTSAVKYDKNGEQHYDIISAFIKSMRGSDPNAAVYWLARMIEGGEEPKFIARRMIILASEDIGNANPTALVLANNCFQAIQNIGMPEGRIILSQTAIYLASSPKSNASYLAINSAIQIVKKFGDQPVPLHLRNAPTKLMEEIGYGRNYQYSHDFDGNFAEQEFLPENLAGQTFYVPGENEREKAMKKHLNSLWKGKYGY